MVFQHDLVRRRFEGETFPIRHGLCRLPVVKDQIAIYVKTIIASILSRRGHKNIVHTRALSDIVTCPPFANYALGQGGAGLLAEINVQICSSRERDRKST